MAIDVDKIEVVRRIKAVITPKQWDKLWTEVKANSSVRMVYGNHEASWLSFYDYFDRAVGLTEIVAPLHNMMDLSMEAGWSIFSKDICFLSERHESVHLDETNRLHNPTGPAFRYADGFEAYFWQGTKVPEDWIMDKENLTVDKIFAEANAELRRAGCLIIGWDRVFKGIKAELIDDENDPQIGKLYQGTLPDAETCKFLKVECGTKREFVIPVPMEVENSIAAQAWVQGVDVKDWVKPEVRT